MLNTKLTVQQEGFCQTVCSQPKITATDAYRANYDCANMLDSTVNREAKTLMDHPKISTRIAELRQESKAIEAAVKLWDLERAQSEIETNLEQSRRLNQMAPAVQSVKQAMELAKLTDSAQAPGSIQVTQVTIVLSDKTESVIEGESRVVEGE